MYGGVGKDDVGAIAEEYPLGDKPVKRLKVPAGIVGWQQLLDIGRFR